MAPKHLPGPAPDKVATTITLIRHGVEQFKLVPKLGDFFNIAQQVVPAAELNPALEQQARNDPEVDDDTITENKDMVAAPGHLVRELPPD